MARDPICGMEVDPRSAFASREHMNRTFYLCSQNCVDKFDSNPHQYAHQVFQPSNQHGEHSGNGNGHTYAPTALLHVELPVVGLRRSGITPLEHVISTIPGVSKAIVNVSDNRIFVDYDPTRSNVSDLLEVVRGPGFTPGVQTLRLKVFGSYCAECVARIEDALKRVPSVFDATMNAATEEVKVDYTPTIGDLNLLTQAVEKAGPYRAARASEASESEMDKEAQMMDKEYYSLMLRINALTLNPSPSGRGT